MKQIVEAVQYLHFNKIVHRDIKLENIMVNFNNPEDYKNLNMMKAQIKLIDFGASRFIDDNLLQTAIGSIDNMDPIIMENFEKITKKQKDFKKYTEKCDIWSLGTICYELTRGKKLFEVNSFDEKIEKIKEGNYRIPVTFSNEITSFLNSMLQYNEKNRKSASELLNHKFLTKNFKDFTYQTNANKNYEKAKSSAFGMRANHLSSNNINTNFNITNTNFTNNNITTNNVVNNNINSQFNNFQQAYGFDLSFYGQSKIPIRNDIHHKSDMNLNNYINPPISQPSNFTNYTNPGNKKIGYHK